MNCSYYCNIAFDVLLIIVILGDEKILYSQFKVHLTPKYFFRLSKSLHLFETHCTFLN